MMRLSRRPKGSRERQLEIGPELVHHLHSNLDEILAARHIARSALVSG